MNVIFETCVPKKWKRYTEKDLPRTFLSHLALGEDGKNALIFLLNEYENHNVPIRWWKFNGPTCYFQKNNKRICDKSCKKRYMFTFWDIYQEDPSKVSTIEVNVNYIILDGEIGFSINDVRLEMVFMDIIKLHDGTLWDFLIRKKYWNLNHKFDTGIYYDEDDCEFVFSHCMRTLMILIFI